MKALMNFHPQGYVLKAVLVMVVAAFLVLIACQPDGRTAEPPIRSTVEPTVQSTSRTYCSRVPPGRLFAVPLSRLFRKYRRADRLQYRRDNGNHCRAGPGGLCRGRTTEMPGGERNAVLRCIDSFNYSEGYTWRLKVERYDAWPDLDEPPQDAERYGYRIIDVVSRTWDDARGPRPARDIFGDNMMVYIANRTGTWLRPPSSVQELVNEAEVIAIGSVAAVVATGLQVPYNESDNTRLDEYNAQYGNPAPYPPPRRSWPYIDYWIDVERVILDDGTISSGSPLILRVFDRWQAVDPYPWMWRVPSIGDRRLYTLIANPEGRTHRLINHWTHFIIDGDEVTHSDDLRSPVYFTDQVKPDDFIKALEDAVDRKSE